MVEQSREYMCRSKATLSKPRPTTRVETPPQGGPALARVGYAGKSRTPAARRSSPGSGRMHQPIQTTHSHARKTIASTRTQITSMSHAQGTITPRWLTYESASKYSGLGPRTLQNHINAGILRSSNACAPGNSRGRRLIDRESLDSFIEAGVGKAPTTLAMNLNKKRTATHET